MSRIYDADDERRFQLFNGPQADPSLRGRRHGFAYRNLRRQALHPDDFAPLPFLAGRHLRAVPPALLLWIEVQPWAARWEMWQPVRDYICRHPLAAILPAEVPLFVDAVQVHPGATGIFKNGSCHLHTLPGFEHYLHAFALGAVGMRYDWFQDKPGRMPHYDLTPTRQDAAIKSGAVLIDRRQMGQHLQLWRQHQGMVESPAGEWARERPDGHLQCTKHCYADKKAADSQINLLTQGRRHYRRQRPKYLRAYACGKCGFYHLTSKPLNPAPGTPESLDSEP